MQEKKLTYDSERTSCTELHNYCQPIRYIPVEREGGEIKKFGSRPTAAHNRTLQKLFRTFCYGLRPSTAAYLHFCLSRPWPKHFFTITEIFFTACRHGRTWTTVVSVAVSAVESPNKSHLGPFNYQNECLKSSRSHLSRFLLSSL